MTGHWDDIAVDDSSMRCYLTKPQGVEGPGVLVCMGGFGVDGFITCICEQLASSGFAAIAPDFYHRQSEPRGEEPWTKVIHGEALRDMTEAIGALRARSGIAPDRVGVIGFCIGGRLAFLHAANNPALRAAVVFYGERIKEARDGMESPFAQAGNIRAPVLQLFGREDKDTSPGEVEAIDSELERLGKKHDLKGYEGAGHGFLNFTDPKVYCPKQAKEAWAECLAWLNQYL